jgi:alkanesulfonate monooxygenase SsuD/methylene tetrahydromethanopterin reductase-like flavin-dependent oxidoreductase (luciferase family)
MRHAAEMRVGTIILQTQPWSGMAGAFRTAEQIGYDVAYVADHLTHPSIAGRWLADGFTVLAAAATVTTRIDLGTLVASAVIRNPVTLARAAATVDDISGGRLVLGLGAGTAGDAVADRGSAPSTREMADRLSDVVGALEALWAGEPDFVGDHATYRDVLTVPAAPGRGRPFTMIAAHGPRGLALAAAHGDGWSTYGGAASVPLAPDEFWDLVEVQSGQLTQRCEERGRDPASVRRSVLLGYGTVQPLADAASYVAAVERAAAAGFDEVVVYWPDGQPGGRFWSDADVHAEALARLAQ